MRKWLPILLASLITIPVAFAVSLVDAFNPLTDILIAIFNIFSLDWLTRQYYAGAVKFLTFIALLAIINSSLSKFVENKRTRGVIAFAVSAISVIFLPVETALTIGNQWGGILGFLLLCIPCALILRAFWPLIGKISDERWKNIGKFFWALFGFIYTTAAAAKVGLDVTRSGDPIEETLSYLLIIFPLMMLWFLGASIMSLLGGVGAKEGGGHVGEGLGKFFGSIGKGLWSGSKKGASAIKKGAKKYHNFVKDIKKEAARQKGLYTDWDTFTKKINKLIQKEEKDTLRVLQKLEKEWKNEKPSDFPAKSAESKSIAIKDVQQTRDHFAKLVEKYKAELEKIQYIITSLQLEQELNLEPYNRFYKILQATIADIKQITSEMLDKLEGTPDTSYGMNEVGYLLTKNNIIKKNVENLINAYYLITNQTQKEIYEIFGKKKQELQDKLSDAKRTETELDEEVEIDSDTKEIREIIDDVYKDVSKIGNDEQVEIPAEFMRILDKEGYDEKSLSEAVHKLETEVETLKKHQAKVQIEEEYHQLRTISTEITKKLQEVFADYTALYNQSKSLIEERKITKHPPYTTIVEQHKEIEQVRNSISTLFIEITNWTKDKNPTDPVVIERLYQSTQETRELTHEFETIIYKQKEEIQQLIKRWSDTKTLQERIKSKVKNVNNRINKLVLDREKRIAELENKISQKDKEKLQGLQTTLYDTIRDQQKAITYFETEVEKIINSHGENVEELQKQLENITLQTKIKGDEICKILISIGQKIGRVEKQNE